MGEGFEFVFWLIVVAAFWLRGLAAAAKKAREREQSALEGTERRLDVEVDDGPTHKKKGLREQWLDMARQIEQQMQQAADEGRPGSLVPHVDDDDEDHVITLPGRRVLPAAERQALDDPFDVEVAGSGFNEEGAHLPVRTGRRELERQRTRELERRRRRDLEHAAGRQVDVRRVPQDRSRLKRPHRQASAPNEGATPLERLERYSPAQRAIILAEILGPPPGLKDDDRY